MTDVPPSPQPLAGARGDLSIILSAIATASKAVTSAVRRAGMLSLYGLHGSMNSTGDDQKKLDVIANDIWINSLKHTHLVGVMVSEENDEPIVYPDLKDAKYAVAFDPLDGSSESGTLLIARAQRSGARLPRQHGA